MNRRTVPKEMKTGKAIENSRAAKWKRVRYRDNRTVTEVGLGGEECWCGQEYGHDWPGRADGSPHPR